MKKLKYILLIVVTVLLVACPAKAQVFIMDDEFEGTMRQNTEDFGLIVPIEGLDSDPDRRPRFRPIPSSRGRPARVGRPRRGVSDGKAEEEIRLSLSSNPKRSWFILRRQCLSSRWACLLHFLKTAV